MQEQLRLIYHLTVPCMGMPRLAKLAEGVYGWSAPSLCLIGLHNIGNTASPDLPPPACSCHLLPGWPLLVRVCGGLIQAVPFLASVKSTIAVLASSQLPWFCMWMPGCHAMRWMDWSASRIFSFLLCFSCIAYLLLHFHSVKPQTQNRIRSSSYSTSCAFNFIANAKNYFDMW